MRRYEVIRLRNVGEQWKRPVLRPGARATVEKVRRLATKNGWKVTGLKNGVPEVGGVRRPTPRNAIAALFEGTKHPQEDADFLWWWLSGATHAAGSILIAGLEHSTSA